MQIECVDVWGTAREVLAEAAAYLLIHFMPPLEGRIRVFFEPNATDPFCFSRKSEDEDFRIQVTCAPALWNQLVYQFSHELLHVIRDNRNDYQNAWFDEALAELASIFVLRQMADRGVNREYATHYSSYSDRRLAAHPLPAGQHLMEWFKLREPKLRANRNDRELTDVVGVQLFPLFQKAPSNWQSIRYLPRTDVSFADYLTQWQAACRAADHRAFVADIGGQFGIQLHLWPGSVPYSGQGGPLR